MDAAPLDPVAVAAAGRPHAPAVEGCDGETLTYAELDERVGRMAATLRDRLPEGPNRRVAVTPVPDPAGIATLWAVWRIGATAVLVDPANPAVVTAAGSLTRTVVDRLPMAPARAEGRAAPGAAHSIVFTSGSGGRPRGVLLTRDNVTAAVAASQARLGNDADDRWLLVLPLFHVGGLAILWRSAAAGGTVVVHDRFRPERVAAALAAGAVDFASLVPTMLRRVLAAHPGPYRGVTGVLLGGAPAPVALVRRGLDAGLPILATYGMTETCAQVATVTPGREREELGTVGRPLEGMEVHLVDGDGDPVPAGTVGEIVVDGPAVSPGYVDAAPRHGPHRTGDLGRFDDRGRLVPLGRVDDVVVTGGENVHPQAVAAVLEEHPGVTGAVVAGVADEEWGSVLAAVVAGTDLDEGALRRHARERLPGYAVPKRWRLVPELPTLPNGKPDRIAARRLLE